MAKAAFDKKKKKRKKKKKTKNFFTSKLDTILKKKRVECYYWSIDFCGVEIGHLGN